MIFISCFLNILGYFLKYRHPSSVLFSKIQSTMQTENHQTSFTNWLSYCISPKKPFSIWVLFKLLCIISSFFWKKYFLVEDILLSSYCRIWCGLSRITIFFDSSKYYHPKKQYLLHLHWYCFEMYYTLPSAHLGHNKIN
jgi:hypothetical protein